MSRVYTGRKAVISFEGGFHGRTWLALALTSKTTPYKQGLLPLAGEVYRVPYAYPYRPPVEPGEESLGEACAGLLEKLFSSHVAPEDVAALIVEPVLGEGGFVVPPDDYLPALKERCEARDSLHLRRGPGGVRAHRQDVRCRALGGRAGPRHPGQVSRGGVSSPRSWVGRRCWTRLRREPGRDLPGNPVALASAMAVLDKFEDGHLLRRSREVGERIRERFSALAGRVDLIGEVRGLGSMVAVEFVKDRNTRSPPRARSEILKLAAERGVLVLSAGVAGNCLRFLAPLVITDEQLEEALDVLERCVEEVAATRETSPRGSGQPDLVREFGVGPVQGLRSPAVR